MPLPDTDRTWWFGLAGMLVALVIPVFLVAVPPLLDYPNHLARAYVLAVGRDDPFLSAMFGPRWGIIPNLAIDLIVPALMTVFDVHTAGRVTVAFSLILVVTGAIALSVAYFRQRSFWQLGAGLAAYNTLFLMGFINFQLAFGAALWSAAGWVRYRETVPITIVTFSAAASIAVFFFHMFGFIFFALLIGSYEIAEALKRYRRSEDAGARFLLRRAVALLVVLAPPLLLYGISPARVTPGEAVWASIQDKSFYLFFPFLSYNLLVDAFLMASVVSFILICALFRKARYSLGAAICSVALISLYFILPTGWKGGYFIDARITVLLGLMLFISVVPAGLPTPLRKAAATILVSIFVLKLSLIGLVWLRSERDVAAVRQVISDVPPGSRVLLSHVWTDVKDSPFGTLSVTSRRIPWVVEKYMHLARLCCWTAMRFGLMFSPPSRSNPSG